MPQPHLPWWPPSLSSSPSPTSDPSHPSHSSGGDNRRLTRAKQLRHLRGRDLKDLDSFLNSPAAAAARHPDDRRDLLRTASSPPPPPQPQPLPLPDLSALFSCSDKFRGRRDRLRLPSPTSSGDAGNISHLHQERETPDRGRVVPQEGRWSVDAQRRVVARRNIDAQRRHGAQRSVHHAETWSFMDDHQKTKGADIGQQKFSVDVTFRSAPASANTSPMVSPQWMFIGDIFSLHLVEPKSRSDPPMPLGFSYAMVPETSVVSHDNSPLQSPQVKSAIPPRKSTGGSASPRHPKLSVEISSVHHDTNVLHPLPLPPTPTSSAQASPAPQVTTNREISTMKNQWTKGKLIGRGTFGSVYVATNRETGALCAMKEVELFPDDPKSAECIRQLEQEIKVLSKLKHPNIVRYYGSEIVDDRFYIYLEYVYPGSINKYVREHCGAITEAVVRNFTRHILSGLAYLHDRKTIHRDIKGANLLVDAAGVVKLADFGMAKHLTGQAANLSLKGSPYWMAPELMQAVMQKENSSSDLAFAVDIWSLGCTVIEMLTGKPPWSDYEGAAAMFKVLKESPPIPEALSPEGKDFLHCCFRRNPAERSSASKLLDHPFLRNSLQLDAQSSSRNPKHLNPADRTRTPREIHDHKPDKVPMSPSRWSPNRKGIHSGTGLLTHLEAPDLTMGCRYSPRSILEPVTSLSPPRLGSATVPRLMASSNVSNTIALGIGKDVFSAKLLN